MYHSPVRFFLKAGKSQTTVFWVWPTSHLAYINVMDIQKSGVFLLISLSKCVCTCICNGFNQQIPPYFNELNSDLNFINCFQGSFSRRILWYCFQLSKRQLFAHGTSLPFVIRANWEVGHTQKTSICDFPAFRKKRKGEWYIKMIHFSRNGRIKNKKWCEKNVFW